MTDQKRRLPRAIVLCGGQGIRLRPLTNDVPKALVPIHGKPIIDYIVHFLRGQGIDEITIAGGYLVERLMEHFHGTDIDVIDTGEVDIIERIRALVHQDEESVLVLYGDTLSDVSISQLLAGHQRSGAMASVTVWPLQSNFGLFELDQSDFVTSYQEKPTLDKWINIGYFVLSRSVYSQLSSFTTFESFLSSLTTNGHLHAHRHSGLHVTVNSRSELEDAERLLASLEDDGRSI